MLKNKKMQHQAFIIKKFKVRRVNKIRGRDFSDGNTKHLSEKKSKSKELTKYEEEISRMGTHSTIVYQIQNSYAPS